MSSPSGVSGASTASGGRDHHPAPPRAADDARFYDCLPANVPAREGQLLPTPIHPLDPKTRELYGLS